MKIFLKRFFLFSTAIWVYFGICPLIIAQIISAPPTAAEPPAVLTDGYRIYNEYDGTVLTVPEKEFLPCALLCELSPDAPDEVIKAQIVAIHTTCTRMRNQNIQADFDFTCNTAAHTVYAPPEALAEKYGDAWPENFERIQKLCSEVGDELLYYEGECITAPYFAVSAGCTQSYADAWGENDLPYLIEVPCPTDALHNRYRTQISLTPGEIQTAFPTVTFTDTPEDWFSDRQTNAAEYVTEITLCGMPFTGSQVRTALSLKSGAFNVEFDGSQFVFTTIGHGHGVGMSQSTAVYMAEHGAIYTDILQYFYPGTTLK